MKLKVNFKTPDALSHAIMRELFYDVEDISELTTDGAEALQDHMKDTMKELEKWVEFGECVTIEFDTDKGTATVVPRK
jgi:hypothetical protein